MSSSSNDSHSIPLDERITAEKPTELISLEWQYNATFKDLSLSIYGNQGEQENLLYVYGDYEIDSRLIFIHFAALHGDLRLLKLVVDVYSEVNPDLLYERDIFGRCALHFAAHQGHHEIIEWLLQQSAEQPHPQCSLKDYYKRTPLHEAALGKHVETVRLLVLKGAKVNAGDSRGYPPLMKAHRNVKADDSDSKLRYEEIVEILVTKGASVNAIEQRANRSALHYAVALDSIKATKILLSRSQYLFFSPNTTTPLHLAAYYGHKRIISTLLDKDCLLLDVDLLDEESRTPLHVAAIQGHLECVRTLVDEGANLAKETPKGDTVIDLLQTYNHDSNLVEFFTDMLDAKVRLSEQMKGPPDKREIIKLDFRMLAPRNQPQMAVVSVLINKLPKDKLIVILQHPLVKSYLGLKWFRFRYLFWSFIVIRAISVILLTYYTVVLVQEDTESTTAGRMLLVFSLIELCIIFWQCFRNLRRYCKRPENWLGLSCTALSTAVAVAGEFNGTASGIPHSVSIAILLSWIRLMLLAGRLPACAFYALMFFNVLEHVIKVLLIGMCIIAGFTLSFSVLFHDNDQFKTPLKTFVKTMVMMTGEYEYKDLFYPDRTNNSTTPKLDPEVTGSIILLSFIIIAGIVLMNLMIGLAVNDIQGLVAEGHSSRLVKQAEFITDYEWMTKKETIWRRFMPKCLKRRLQSIINEIKVITPSFWHNEPNPGISKKLVNDLLQLGLEHRKLNTGNSVENHNSRLISESEQDSDSVISKSRSREQCSLEAHQLSTNFLFT